MKSRKFNAIINSFTHPTYIQKIFRDLFKIRHKVYDNKIHLDSAINWLCTTQDMSETGGCSESYSFDQGWTPPYPETTGYIISTMLKYAKLVNDDSYIERAIKMGDWEIDIQLPTGAVRGGVGVNEYPIVFNTGQVILGWADLYDKIGEKRFLDAAVKAADWLVSIMDEDGKWTKFTYRNIPHAYNSRVAWSVLEVYKHTKDEKYKEAAIKKIKWILSQKTENGWFEKMGFKHDDVPLTHTIAYTLRGLLESSYILDGSLKEEILEVVTLASENIMKYYEKITKDSKNQFLPGRLDENWTSNYSFSCLTGNSQMAIIWLKLFQINGNKNFFDTAVKIIDQVKSTQNLNSRNKGIKGAIAGSLPIWGEYVKFAYPNWATKFYADAIMLIENIKNESEK